MRLFSLLLVACACASTLSTLDAQTNEIYTSFFGLSGSVGAFKQTFDVLTGDIIFTGYSDGSVGVPGQTPIPSVGSNDWFIARYTIGGDLIWFRTIASTGDDRGFTVDTDAQGNIYVGGASNGALTSTRSGGFDPYVAKYSANGTRLWVKNIVSNVYSLNVNENQAIFSIQVDGENLYIVTQEYRGSITVTRWDKEVTASAWKQVVSMPNYLVVTDVTLDSNHNIIISGSRSDGANIPGVEVNGITIPAAISKGGWDGFVLAFNGSSPTGARTMCANQGSSGADQSMAVAVDSTNNIYVTGYVQGNYDDQLWRAQGGRPDVFITKYGPITEKGQGIRLWSRILYPAGVANENRNMRGAKLQVDYVGALYMLTSEQYPTYTSGIQSDLVTASQVYIEKYDSNGNTLWGQALPPAATVAHGFHLDSTGTMYISGIVTSSWGSTPLDRGSQVAFIHKRANPLNCSCNEMASLVDEVMNLAGINVV